MDSSDSLKHWVANLDDEQLAQVASLVVDHDTKQWLEHQQKMFQLRLWAILAGVVIFLFAVGFIGSLCFGHTPDPAFMSILATAMTAILSSAGAQAAITIGTMKKSKEKAKQIESKPSRP